ncbi:EAL domain-containing protein [Lachnospiraceae bacterium LCP19S3_B12]
MKIDRFFFTSDDNPERDMAVVQGIIELVHKFHIRIVAEGVESPGQVEYLRKAGCDYVQGYVFYRPMPQEDYEKLIAERSPGV